MSGILDYLCFRCLWQFSEFSTSEKYKKSINDEEKKTVIMLGMKLQVRAVIYYNVLEAAQSGLLITIKLPLY